MPASSNSSTSCQRLAWREPAALVWASSSTRISAGRRASAASRSNSCRSRAAILDVRAAAGSRGPRAAPRSRPAVRLDVADDTSTPSSRRSRRRLEHRVGLAHAGGGAEEDLELAAPLPRLLLLDAGEERVGIGPVLAHRSSPGRYSTRPGWTAPAPRIDMSSLGVLRNRSYFGWSGSNCGRHHADGVPSCQKCSSHCSAKRCLSHLVAGLVEPR